MPRRILPPPLEQLQASQEQSSRAVSADQERYNNLNSLYNWYNVAGRQIAAEIDQRLFNMLPTTTGTATFTWREPLHFDPSLLVNAFHVYSGDRLAAVGAATVKRQVHRAKIIPCNLPD